MNRALEDLQAGRDPIASQTAVNRSNWEFFHKAANWSFWLPVGASGLVFFIRRLLKDLGAGSESLQQTQTTLVLIGALAVFASLILGLIALCGIPKHGSEGILGKALRGIFTSVTAICVFAYTYSETRANREAMARMHELAVKVDADTRKDFADHKGLSAADGLKRMNDEQNILDNAAHETTGNTALVNKAASAFLQKAKAAMTAYAEAEKGLNHLSGKNIHNVENQIQLDDKRQAVRKFMAANEAVLVFIQNGEQTLKDELIQQHLPAENIETTLQGYRKSSADQNALTTKIRLQDKRMSVSFLTAINLLDANWGHWKYSEETKRVVFNDSAISEQYATCLADITTAAREQVQLQQQLVGLVKN
jgi:hypothetical protein